ncbi:hypothetical protein ACFL1F_00810 [Chlamydiota bacterium]
MNIILELAKKEDNKELLELMDGMSMPGSIQVAYRRDPDFFDALRVEGTVNQTIVGRDSKTKEIAGVGICSIKPMYVNGVEMKVGYLSSLRVKEKYRMNVYLARGYQKLRQLHEDNEALLYLSTMLNDNEIAKKLTTGRARLPAYYDIGQFISMPISLSQSIKYKLSGSLNIRSATLVDIPLIVRFLNSHGKQRQFFPVYSQNDFIDSEGLLPDMALKDILMAFSGNTLVGILAAWDQKKIRRNVITGYSRWVSLSRPFYNLWAKRAGFPVLPPIGSILNCFYLSLVCIRDNDSDVFMSLLSELIERKRSQYSFMLAGMHEKDPLIVTIKQCKHLTYLSRMYVVCWQDGEQLFNQLDNRPPYMELGSM